MLDSTRKLASSAAALGLTVLHSRRTITTVSALALAAVALAGCSAAGDTDAPADSDTTTSQPGGSNDAGINGNASGDEPVEAEVEGVTTYTFDDRRVVDSSDLEPYIVDTAVPVVFELPDDLRAAAHESKTLAVDSFTVDATAFSTGVCRLDVEVDWADGGYEALAEPSRITSNLDEEAAIAIAHVTSNFTFEPALVDELPADEEVEVGVTYVQNDGTAFTHVTQCSEDYEDEMLQLLFSYTEPVAENAPTHLIASDIAVVPGGQGGAEGATLIVDSNVSADVSATGDWTRIG